MHFIDTHCHLNFKAFEGDYLAAAQRAAAKGVEKIIVVGSDPTTSSQAIEICQKINAKQKDFAFAAVGIHPTHTDRDDFSAIEAIAEDPLVVAIGETGFDFYHDLEKKTAKEQADLFFRHIELAGRLHKPLIIHNRNADSEILETISHVQIEKGVFHCFSTDHNFAKTVLEMGYLISFTGNITYGNKKLKKVIERTPLEKIMIETDSPYIVPEPIRSEGTKQNEPAFVAEVAKRLALVKNIDISEVARQTTQNAHDFFNI